MVLPIPPDHPGPLQSADDLEVVRLDELRAYGVLDTTPEQALDELTRLATRLFRVPVALVSLVDEHRQWFMSRVGVDFTETPREQAFCAHAIRGSEVMVVEDAQRDPRFDANPLVTQAPGIRFYAGAPLFTPTGQALGTLCVIDTLPRQFGADEREALQVLSHQVMAQLELQRQNRLLQDRETRLELVLKGANDGWWDWDLRTGERYNSERGWTMLGYAEHETPDRPADWESLIHPDDRAPVAASFQAAIRGRDTHYQAEFRIRHKDGHYLPVLSRGHILRDANGRAVRLSGTNTDLSERQRIDRERIIAAQRDQVIRPGIAGQADQLPHARQHRRRRPCAPHPEPVAAWPVQR